MNRPWIYSVDTSALIDGLERFYPQETFPALWDRVDALIDQGRFLLSEEVWNEARERDAAVKAWCDGRDKTRIVVPTDVSVVQDVQSILATYPKLVKNMKGRNRADAFVISVARLRSGAVVTGEVAGTEDKPKIPFICDRLNVQCMNFLDVIRREGWTFQ